MEESPNRVKCDLCHEGLTRPIMLQCSDVFCLNCLQSYSDKCFAPTGNLKCPVCPRMFNRLEIKSTGVINEGPACAFCSDEIGGKVEIAGWLCLTCDKALCEKDYLNHYQRVGSDSHVVVSTDVARQFSNIIDTVPTESEQLMINAKLCDVEARATANCTEMLDRIMLRFNALLEQLHLEKRKLDEIVNFGRVGMKEPLKSATQEVFQNDSMLCAIKSNRDILTREQLHQVVNCDIGSTRRNLLETLKYVPEFKFFTILVERSIMFGSVNILNEKTEACEPTQDQSSDVRTQLSSLEKNRAIPTYPELMNQISSVWLRLASQTPSNTNSKTAPVRSEPTARNAYNPSADINQALDVGEGSMAKQFPSVSPGLASQAPSNTNSNLLNVRPELQTGIYNDLIPQIHQANKNRQRFPTSELSSASPGLASKTHSNTNYKIPQIEQPENDVYDSESEISQYLETMKNLLPSHLSSACPEIQTVGSNQTANNAFDPIPQIDAQDLSQRFMTNQLSSAAASSRFDSQTPSNENYKMPQGGFEQTANNVFDPKSETSQDLETVKRLLASNLSSACPGLASKTPSNRNYRMQTDGSNQTPNNVFVPIPQIDAQDVSQRFMANQLSSASSRFVSQTHSNDNYKMPSGGSEQTSNNAFNSSAQMDTRDLSFRFMANQSSSASQIPSITHPNSSLSGYERSVNAAFGSIPQINSNEEMFRRMISAIRQVPPPHMTQRPGQVAFGGHPQAPNIELHPQNVAHHQPFSIDPRIILQIQESFRINQQKKNIALNVMASPYIPRVYLQTPMMSNSASNREEGASQWNQMKFPPLESGGYTSQARSVDQGNQNSIRQYNAAPRAGRALVGQSNQRPLGQAASNSVNESEQGQSSEEINTPGKSNKMKSPSTQGRGTTKSLPQHQQPEQY